MIASDFLAAAKVAITEGDHAAANEYLNSARAAVRETRMEALKAVGKAVIQDLERIQSAERLCRYGMTSGRATPAGIALIRALENAPRLHKGKSLFSPQNLAAFEWHIRNRSEIFNLIAEAATEAAEGSKYDHR